MNFPELISDLRSRPEAFLDGVCALSLSFFLAGYKNVDQSACDPVVELLNSFHGPDQACACTRAYLSHSNTSAAAMDVLAALDALVRNRVMKPEPGLAAEMHVVDAVRGPILQQRPAMLLGAPTVIALYNYVRGFLCGLEAVAPVEARRQAQEIANFENWLQTRYEAPSAAWYKIIRVYEGECERGLTEFIRKWDEFTLDPEY